MTTSDQLETQASTAPAQGIAWRLHPATPVENAAGSAGGALGRLGAIGLGSAAARELGRYQRTPKSPGIAGDRGFFGPDTMMWRVMSDSAAMFLAGVGSLAWQGTHPRAFAGFADHTDFKKDPDGRLVRTQRYLMATAFGDLREARSAIDHAKRMHRPVKGTTPDGRTYDASEPELARWVHLALYGALAAGNVRFGAEPMTAAELDRFIAESAVIGEEFGIDDPPTTWAEMDTQIAAYRKEISIDLRAVRGITFYQRPNELGWAMQTLMRTLWPAAALCMPPMCRQLLNLPEPSHIQIASCRAITDGVRQLIGPNPSLVRAQKRIASA